MNDVERHLIAVRRAIERMPDADARRVAEIADAMRYLLKGGRLAYAALALVGAEAACRTG